MSENPKVILAGDVVVGPAAAATPAAEAVSTVQIKLPGWAKIAKDGQILVTDTEVYPMALRRLGIAADKIDQYWLEVARRCFTEELHAKLGRQKMALRIVASEGRPFALKKFPAGRGEAAGMGQFRRYYAKYLAGRDAEAKS